MNKKAVIGIVMVLLLPVTAYFIMKHLSTDAVAMPRHYIFDSTYTKTVDGKQVRDTVWHKLPDYSFTNHLGKSVSWKDLEGKVVVADFFFTHCPTICPRLTQNMKKLQDGISNAKRVGNKTPGFLHFLSFTVDPERDSVPQLKAWADRFQINPETWWLLTGNKKDIYDLSLEHMKLMAVDGKGIDTSFFHTDYMVLIDKNRNIRGYYHGLDTAAVAKLSNDIVLLSLEKDPNRKRFFEGKLEVIGLAVLLAFVGVGLLVYFLRKNKVHGVADLQER